MATDWDKVFDMSGQTYFEQKYRKMKIRVFLLTKEVEVLETENMQLKAEVEMLRKMVPQNVKDGWVNPDILNRY